MSTSKSSCPGSKAIKNPTPELQTCPNCGADVEIWTNELSYPCSTCVARVNREQPPSCIDWCPYVQECIGPAVYKTIKAQPEAAQAGEESSPLDVGSAEHEEAIKKSSLLR